MSVLLPYWPVPLRHPLAASAGSGRRTLRWLVCLGLPYALCVAVDPMSELPRLRDPAPARLPPGPGLHGVELLVLGLAASGACSAAPRSSSRTGAASRFDDLR